MSPADLDATFLAAYQHNGWKAGMMEWQFRSDSDSAKIDQALSSLIASMGPTPPPPPPPPPPPSAAIKFAVVDRIAS